MRDQPPVRVMFVCLGNICRSPLAHGIFETMVTNAGLSDRIEVDSSGTGAWHIGQRPDSRMRRVAQRNGYSLEGLTAQQFKAADLARYDHVYAMDGENLRTIRALGRGKTCRSAIALFRSHDPEGSGDVPDPYYNGRFDEVFVMVERTAARLLSWLVERHSLPRQPGSRVEGLHVRKVPK